jgi:predicted DNA-binding mobile mystery protein A
MKTKGKLVRQQLDATLKRLRPLLNVSMPPKGWIRAIRDALEMNGRQFADLLGVTRQRTDQIENEELAGSATLKAMRRIAECLDCVFVYGFVPRTTLERALRDQARRVAERRLARASQTMSLENQAVSARENKQALSHMIEELVDSPPSDLWDEP